MPLAKIGQMELYYEIDGVGPETVAFINGIAMTVDSWQPIRERFHNQGFRCLLHDCRGQLRSAKPMEPAYSMALHAADLLALLDTLELERVHLVGTSYGSEIGMVFAYTYPDRVKSLTVIAGVSELDSLLHAAVASWAVAADSGAKPLYRCMTPWAYSSSYLARHGQLLRERERAMMQLPADYFTAFKHLVDAFLQLDITAQIKNIACPTLVVSAERDLLKGPHFGRIINEHIAQSEFQVIPLAGHAVVLEMPDQVADLTLSFIDRRTKRTA